MVARNNPDCSTRPGKLAAIVLLSMLVGAMSSACGRRAPGETERLIPATADFALIFPPMESLRVPLMRFADGVEGAAGILEYLTRRFGVDLRDDNGFARAGLDPRAPLALFLDDDILYLAAGVWDRDALEENLAERLRLLGYGDPAGVIFDAPPDLERAHQRALRVLRGRSDASLAPVVYAVHERRLLLARAIDERTAEQVGLAVGKRLAADPGPGLIEAPDFTRVAGGPADNTARVYLNLPRTLLPPSRVRAWTSPLGIAGYLPATVLRSFTALGGRVDLSPDLLQGRFLAARAPESRPPLTSWLSGQEGPAEMAALLPSSAALMMRFNLDSARLETVPRAMRRTVLARMSLGKWHPLFEEFDLERDLLPHFTGNLGLVVLGLNEAATLVSLQKALRDPAKVGDVLHYGMVFEVREPDRLRQVISARLGDLRARATPIVRDSIDPVEFDTPVFASRLEGGPQGELGVLLVGNVAAVVVGRGETERLLRVLSAEAPSLETRPHAALATRVVGSEPLITGGLLTFDRIARQLACKGFPPYFLRILTSPDTVAWSLDTRPDAIELSLEVSL